jgi:conjugal transfer/entry exclusion protein
MYRTRANAGRTRSNGLHTAMRMQAQVSQNLRKTKARWPTS